MWLPGAHLVRAPSARDVDADWPVRPGCCGDAIAMVATGGLDYGLRAPFAVRPKSGFGFAGVIRRKSLASFRDKLSSYPNKRAYPPLGEEYR